jgi:hypothetical protein
MGWDAEDAEAAYWAMGGTVKAARARKLDTIKKETKTGVKMRDMSTEELEGMIEAAQAEISRREKMPLEPRDAYVVTFKIQFTGTTLVYDYAAIRADGVWYVTGREGITKLCGVSWEVMINHFLDRGKFMTLHAMSRSRAIRLP